MTSTTKATVRGCGTRGEGGCYLCLGIGSGGMLHVEDLILDPIRVWPAGWQRGFKLLPNRNDWNDVGIFVGESFYTSLWDFVEEARRFGISRKVPPTFPFEQLTPGKSQMIFFHRRAYPKFDYELPNKIEVPMNGCKFLHDPRLWKHHTKVGYHPMTDEESKCTLAHKHLAGLLHDCSVDSEGCFTVEMPSFSYNGQIPAVRHDNNGNQVELEWLIGAFMVAPISHVECPKKLNNKASNRANKAGYEVIITDW